MEIHALDPEDPATWPLAAQHLVAAARTGQAATLADKNETPPDASPPTRLYLQVGAFSNRDNAVRLRAQLLAAGLSPCTITSSASQDQQILYRIRLGPLESISAADNLLEPLERLGIHESRVVID